MDVQAVTGHVTVLPESSAEVLVDVVNTEDVIDALDVDLHGLPGASIRIESAGPTLFPGERRRLALRLHLPAQVPAGRHRAELEIRTVATGRLRRVDLDIEVPPQPALVAGAHPAVRRARHRVDFPVTVTNRGNTPLHVMVGELDVPDTVTAEFDPAEFDVAAWSSGVCRVRVTGQRRLVGGDQDQVVDLLVSARSSTPGRPLLESSITQETRVTFRQRPAFSPGVVLASVLLTVAAFWLVGGVIGLRTFIRLVDPGSEPAASFFPTRTAPQYPDAAVAVSGRTVSAVDGSPVSAVNVLACSRETTARTGSTRAGASAPTTCTRRNATATTVSDGTGRFWLPGLFPGPYQLTFTGRGLHPRTAPVRRFDASCSLQEAVSARPAALTVALSYPTTLAAPGPVTATVRTATAAPTDAAPTDATPTDDAATTGATEPQATATGSTAGPTIAPPPCPEPSSGSASGSGAAGTSRPTPTPSDDTSSPPIATATGWPTASRAGSTSGDRAGNWTVTLVLPGLPAPARYDLTIDAGPGLGAIIREVHLEADQPHPVIDVPLQLSPAPTPSSGPGPGTP